MAGSFLLTQGTTGTIVNPAVGANVSIAVVSTALFRTGMTVRVIHSTSAGLGAAGQGTFTVASVDSATQFTGTYLGASGDSGVGASFGQTGSVVILIDNPTFASCDGNSLISASPCFDLDVLDERDRDAIAIYARIASLAAVGGTDYSASLTTLLTASNSWKMLNDDQIGQISLYETINSAIVNGAAISTVASALKTAAATYRTMKASQRKQTLAYLKCLLNTRGLPA